MNNDVNNYKRKLAITARVFIALIGGYYLACLSSIFIATVVLQAQVDDIAAGMMLSFIIYATVALTAFSMKSLLRLGLFLIISILLLISANHFLAG